MAAAHILLWVAMNNTNVLTIRATRWGDRNNVIDGAIIRLLADACQAALIPVQASACRMVKAVVRRHDIDLLAYVIPMTVERIRQPRLAHRVCASSAIGYRRSRSYNQLLFHNGMVTRTVLRLVWPFDGSVQN